MMSETIDQATMPRGDAATRIIDAAVYPQMQTGNDLRNYMEEPWRRRPFPGPERYYYPALGGEFLPSSEHSTSTNPTHVADHLFATHGVSKVVLIPTTRGLLPDIDVGTAICSAVNRWLSETWLDQDNRHDRFAGIIRVNPSDPVEAVAEIERWANHPHMVAICVPMQAHAPYGQRQYFPIWQAADAHGLPIVVKLDGGSGVDFWPTAVGPLHHFIEYSTLAPINYAYHLISFIAEGTFERLPNLRIMFADGGHDMAAALVWRMDKIWRPTRTETPWMVQSPGDYLRKHVRFCTRKLEGPPISDQSPLGAPASWHTLNSTKDLLLYASSYPYHDCLAPNEALLAMEDDVATAVAYGNAEALFFRQ